MDSECKGKHYWFRAIAFAPIVPILLFLIYLIAIDAPIMSFFAVSLPLGFAFYLIFVPTYIFSYSRIIHENVFFSSFGGFIIPMLLFWIFSAEFDLFFVWFGVFGAACGICFDYLFHGLNFNFKIEFNHEDRE